jgi:hypothetical protein
MAARVLTIESTVAGERWVGDLENQGRLIRLD